MNDGEDAASTLTKLTGIVRKGPATAVAQYPAFLTAGASLASLALAEALEALSFLWCMPSL